MHKKTQTDGCVNLDLISASLPMSSVQGPGNHDQGIRIRIFMNTIINIIMDMSTYGPMNHEYRTQYTSHLFGRVYLKKSKSQIKVEEGMRGSSYHARPHAAFGWGVVANMAVRGL